MCGPQTEILQETLQRVHALVETWLIEARTAPRRTILDVAWKTSNEIFAKELSAALYSPNFPTPQPNPQKEN